MSVGGPPAIQCGSSGVFSATVREGLTPVLGAAVTFSSNQPGSFFPSVGVTNAAGTAVSQFVPSVSTFGATATVTAMATGGIPAATGQAGSTIVTILCGAATTLCNPQVQSCFNTCVPGTFVTTVNCLNPCLGGTFVTTAGCVNQCTAVFAAANCFSACPTFGFSGFTTACVQAGNFVAPVTATQVSVIAPSAATCGSVVSVSALLRNSFGLVVPSGTITNFSSTLGQISGAVQTIGGSATVALTLPARTSGTAVVTATSGGATGSASIAVSCPVTAAPVSVAPAVAAPVAPAVVAAPAAVPVFRVPSAGDAGLADPSYSGNRH